MPGTLLKTGDLISFIPLGPHVCPLIIAPLPLSGKGKKMTIANQIVCVEGDEIPDMLKAPLDYISPPYVIPGKGELDVKPPANCYTMKTTLSGKKIMILAPPFQAEFKVRVPAMQPSPGPAPPIPDSSLTKKYMVQYIPTILQPLVSGA